MDHAIAIFTSVPAKTMKPTLLVKIRQITRKSQPKAKFFVTIVKTTNEFVIIVSNFEE